jgi:cytochrome P450
MSQTLTGSTLRLKFGYGSRSCIGKNVVQLELYKLWATLLRMYKVSWATALYLLGNDQI